MKYEDLPPDLTPGAQGKSFWYQSSVPLRFGCSSLFGCRSSIELSPEGLSIFSTPLAGSLMSKME
jgi:hypothetical protein